MSNNDRNTIVESVTRMLSRREHSITEIRRKLLQKGLEPETFEPIICEFSDAGLQSDFRFTESRVRALVAKGSGPLKIRADLAAHNISSAIIDDVFNELDVDFFSLAIEVRHKKFGNDLPPSYAEKAKQMRFLQSRGFDMSQIQCAFES